MGLSGEITSAYDSAQKFASTPAEITFHRVNPSGCYKEILFEDQGILEPLEVGVDKVISFTPTETGDFEFSC